MRIILLVSLIVSLSVSAQNINTPKENGAIFKLYDGTLLLGELISFNESPYKLKILTGDTVTINPRVTKRIYLPQEINLYSKGSYSYKKGITGSIFLGASPEHVNIDIKGSYIFRNKFSVGMGIGYHHNSFMVRTISSTHFGDVISRTYFLTGQYYFTQKAKRIYATGRFGFADHVNTNQITFSSDGVILEGGIGIEFATKRISKYYLELTQYTTNGKGALVSNDVNALSDIDFDIWFNRIVFTMGVQIGK